MRLTRSENRRRGAIAPLMAILMTILLGLVAFAVDLAWIVQTQADLQNAADSAALAGAGQLMTGYVQYNLPGQTQQSRILTTSESSATTYAQNFASYNAAGGVSSLTLNSSDIVFSSTTNSTFPNTIQVTMRRDSSANGSLSLFFAPVFGVKSQNLTAKASAAIYAANIDSFQNVSNLKIALLPVTYDVNHWNNFLKTGQNPDGGTTTDSSGNPDLQVYPSVKFTGNFGLLGLDDSHAGASTVSGWITNGLTQPDLQNLLTNSAADQTPLIPLSQHNPNILPSASTDGMGSWNWVGDTGMKTSVIHTLENYVGQTFLLPLFKPLNDGTSGSYAAGNGNGSHYYYNIVQFVGVKLVSAADKAVVVEPSPMVIDFNMATFQSTPAPAGSSSSSSSSSPSTTFVAPKLTQ
jgi:Flp pilus assembly protein TadG